MIISKLEMEVIPFDMLDIFDDCYTIQKNNSHGKNDCMVLLYKYHLN